MNEEEREVNSLRKTKKILDEHDIQYWLDEGTLLGAVREKKLIPWDHDIDLSIWYTALPKIIPLFNEFKNVGFEVCFFEWKKHIKLINEDSEIDINLYRLENKKATRTWYEHNKLGKILDYIMWTYHINNADLIKSDVPKILTRILVGLTNALPAWLNKKNIEWIFKIYEKKGCRIIKMSVPSSYFEKFKKISFYDMKINAPEKIEKYLEYRYGKDWKTPKRDYVYTRDDKSIIKK